MTGAGGGVTRPLWSDDERTVARRMLALEDARAKAKVDRGVSLTDLAVAMGITPNTLGKWLRCPPLRLDGAATNRMDAAQVRSACELLCVSEDYLRDGIVVQPMMLPVLGPSEATTDRYTSHRLAHAYAMLNPENQRKATSYVADLLRLQQAERALAVSEAEATTVSALAREAMSVMGDRLGDPLDDLIVLALDSYESAVRHQRLRWATDREVDYAQVPAALFWERAAECHRKASNRGRKAGATTTDL